MSETEGLPQKKRKLSHSQIAGMGGKKVFEKRGREYMSYIGRRGAEARKAKQSLQENSSELSS